MGVVVVVEQYEIFNLGYNHEHSCWFKSSTSKIVSLIFCPAGVLIVSCICVAKINIKKVQKSINVFLVLVCDFLHKGSFLPAHLLVEHGASW